MKVYIGPYVSWIGPYQIADKIFFWVEKYPSKEQEQRWDYRLHDRFGKWLASTWVDTFCQWIHSKKKRTEIVKIDYYDVWSLDHSLSLIVVPMLKRLKEVKHGAPFIDDEDVPANLRSTTKSAQKAKKNPWDTDGNHFKRFDWVLDEMIWAHEQIIDDNGEDKFYDHTEAEKETDFCKSISKIKVDRKGLKAYHDRINNGLRLFGKYYRALWD
jgi:hypothetical protein